VPAVTFPEVLVSLFPFTLLDKLEGLKALDPAVRKLQPRVRDSLSSSQVKDLLHGKALGHPLHSILVQLPIGCWTSALLLDLLPGKRHRAAADALAVTGVLAALPAAVSGAADWSELNPSKARTGLVHAVVNDVALTLWVESVRARRKGRRGRGTLLGLLGGAAVAVGGTIGGHLAYRQGAGVDQNAAVADVGPRRWTDAGAFDDLPDGQLTLRRAGSVDVVLLRTGQGVAGLVDRCSHQAGPLHQGRIVDDGERCVVCPWHGATYRLRDGAVVSGPSVHPQPAMETRIRNGRVEVQLAGE
jgi:nitrite reductase/ring-hydroxylating ferredoxin subunit/uncharacterized membrane protein